MKRGLPEPLDTARFKDFAGSSFMGCGEFNPFAEGKDEKSRRVTLLIFDPAADPGDLPCRVGDIAPCKANLLGPNDPPRGQPDDKVPFFRCKVFRDLSKKCPCCGGGDDQKVVFRYALDASGTPWSDDAIVRIVSEDGSHFQSFNFKDGTVDQGLRVFQFDDARPGVRYKGQIHPDDTTIFGLFGFVALSKIVDPNDPTHVLPLPAVTVVADEPPLDVTPATLPPTPPGEQVDPSIPLSAVDVKGPVPPPKAGGSA
jgi:hypothetical protein